MIRVRVVKCTVGDGGRVIGIGEVLSLPDAEARFLVARGKAEVVADVPMGVGAPAPQVRDPVVTRTRSGGGHGGTSGGRGT